MNSSPLGRLHDLVTQLMVGGQHVTISLEGLRQIAGQMGGRFIAAQKTYATESLPLDDSICMEAMFQVIVSQIDYCFLVGPNLHPAGGGSSSLHEMARAAFLRQEKIPIDQRAAAVIDDLAEGIRQARFPLTSKRLQHLGEARDYFAGKYADFVLWLQSMEQDGYTADQALMHLVRNFPNMADDLFLKRACRLLEVLAMDGRWRLSWIGDLPAPVGCRLPAILRRWEILSYSQNLSNQVDRYEIIRSLGPVEMRLRATTIHAVQMLAQAASTSACTIWPVIVDQVIGPMGESLGPFHQTITTDY